MSVGKIVWPGGTHKTPTDRGTPGKPLFKIGFIAPLHSGLGILSEHGKELVSAAKVAVDIINADRNQHVEIDLKVMDEGLDGTTSCKTAAENLLAYNVAAIVGAYRSSCSIAVSRASGMKSSRPSCRKNCGRLKVMIPENMTFRSLFC